MFNVFLLLMIIVPALEILGIFLVGQFIGGWPTFLLILLTGFFGAFLTKQEAKKVWSYAQHQLSMGQIPGAAILDGICIFAGGLLLLTPGFITDVIGFLLVFSGTRAFFRAWLLWLIRRYINFRRMNRL